MRYWSVYFVFLFSRCLLSSLFSVWGGGWMCVPSRRRVPAGHGAPVAGWRSSSAWGLNFRLVLGRVSQLSSAHHTGQLVLEHPRVSSFHLPCPIECWDYRHVLYCARVSWMGSRDPNLGCQPYMVSTFTHGAISSSKVFLLHDGDPSEAQLLGCLPRALYLVSSWVEVWLHSHSKS